MASLPSIRANRRAASSRVDGDLSGFSTDDELTYCQIQIQNTQYTLEISFWYKVTCCIVLILGAVLFFTHSTTEMSLL